MARLLASTTAHSRSSLSVTAACAYICALNAPRIANRLTARASSTMNPTNGHSTNPAAAHTARRKKKNGQAEADGDSSTARTVPTTEDTIAAMSSLSLNARSVQLNERDQRPNAVNAIRAPRNDNQRLNTTTSTKAPSSQSLQQKAYQRRPIATSSSKASSSQSLWRDDYQRPTTNSSSKASTSQAYLDKTTSALIPLTSQCRTISASTKPSRILLVFDLNGTLLDRLSFKHEDRHAFRENPYAPRMADFTEQKRKIFVRPL